MEGDSLSGSIAPMFFKLDSKTDASGQTVQPGLLNAREKAGVWRLSAGSDLDILEKRYFSYSYQDLNPMYSSIYLSHCTDCCLLITST
jgi:hypothetical protein